MPMQRREDVFQKQLTGKESQRDGTAFFSIVAGLLFLTMTWFYYRESSVFLTSGITRIPLIGNVSVIGGIILGIVYFSLASLCLVKPNRNVFLASAIFSGVMSFLSFSLQVLPSSVTSYTTLYYLTFFDGYQLAIGVIGLLIVYFSLQAFRSYSSRYS
jgi:hypothetical protein